MPRKLVVEIIGDASSLEKAYKRGTVSSTGFGNSIAKTAAKVAGAVGGLYILQKAAHSAWTEFADGQKVFAQTQAVIKSTGGVANVTAKQVQAYAKTLENLSGIDDEVIQGGEQLLLTFKNIRNQQGKGNDIFNQTTLALLDMQVAMTQAGKTGDSIKESAVRVGKALNDPIKGLTALKRVGVTFSDSQTKAITNFVKTGKVMEAQKVILAELRSEFGGSAKALGDTIPGQLNKLGNAFNDIGGDIVANLAGGSGAGGALQRLVKYMQDAGNQRRIVERVSDAIRKVASAIETMANVLRTAAGVLRPVINALGGLKGVLIALVGIKVASWVAGAMGSIGKLATAIKLLPVSVSIPIAVIVGATFAYPWLKKMFEEKFGADFSGPQGAGDLVPVKRGGKWVDPNTGKPVADQAYWNKRSGGSGVAHPTALQNVLAPVVGLFDSIAAGAKAGMKPEGKSGTTPYTTSGVPGDKTGKGAKGAAGEPAWMRQLRHLQLLLSKAQLTTPLKDDVTVLEKIIAFLKTQHRLHKKNLDISQELVSAEGELISLRQQQADDLKSAMEDVKGQIPALFGGPLLAPTEDDIRRKLGAHFPDAGALTADLKASNAAVSAWQKDLATIAKRGGSHALIAELTGMGIGGAGNVAALAHAGGPALQAFFAAYQARQKQIARVAKLEIAAQHVTIRVGPRGAGGPLRPPDRGVPNLSIYLDGNDITKSTLTRTQRKQRQTAAQIRGRLGGAKIFG